MMPSPIQLLQLTFKRVRVEVDPDHTPPEPTNPLTTVFVFDGITIATEFGLADIDLNHERGGMYFASLRVLVDNQPVATVVPQRFSPYFIDLEAAGVILIPKGNESPASPHDLVSVNGAAVLWSAIREQVLAITSRMPAGPVMLPTVHFLDLREANSGDVKAAEPARAAVAKRASPAKPRAASRG